jgi:fructokinase
MLIGGIEAGGTKFVCGVGNEEGSIIDRKTFETKNPQITMPQVIAYFKQFDIEALGVGSFGPIDLNKNSNTYGYITSTPKLAWKNYNLIGALKEHFQVPIGFDTDVNAAALGESLFGAARGLRNVLYITIGTGIGAGALVNGQLVHGMLHPEMGHIPVSKRHDDLFEGVCPYHRDCLEGLASGPAIEQRYNKKGHELESEDSVWELMGHYLSQAIVSFVYTLSPQKIILGGGVSKQVKLLNQIRTQTIERINGYLQTKEIETIDQYIVNPGLGDNAGLVGCICLGLIELK